MQKRETAKSTAAVALVLTGVAVGAWWLSHRKKALDPNLTIKKVLDACNASLNTLEERVSRLAS